MIWASLFSKGGEGGHFKFLEKNEAFFMCFGWDSVHCIKVQSLKVTFMRNFEQSAKPRLELPYKLAVNGDVGWF